MFDIQKASLVKRFAAFLLDFILILIVITGLVWGFSELFSIDVYANDYFAKYDLYETDAQRFVAELDGLDPTVIGTEAYDALTDEEKEAYVKAFNDHYDAYTKRFNELFSADQEAVYAQNMTYNLILITLIASILISVLIFEFVFPLIFKNGQTIGKKVVGIAVIHQNSVKASHIALFTRALLGKFVVEIMIPLILIITALLGYTGWIGLLVLGLLCILEAFVFFKGKNFTPLHDVICQTICVDNATQMVFDSVEELTEYKKAKHAEEVRDSYY